MFCSKPQRSPKVINKKHIYTSTYFYHNVEIKCHHASYPVLDISPTLPFLNISWICIEHYNLLVCFRPHKKMYENYLCLFQLKANKCKLSFVYFNHLEILFSAVYVGLVPVQHHLLPMFRPIGHVHLLGFLGFWEIGRKGWWREFFSYFRKNFVPNLHCAVHPIVVHLILILLRILFAIRHQPVKQVIAWVFAIISATLNALVQQ